MFLVATLVGISQIGAIVCSLGSLGKGVLAVDPTPLESEEEVHHQSNAAEEADESAPLLDDGLPRPERISRVRLKGSIAGVYSWCGGAAILLLTKLGGYLFDVLSTGAPFYMMAIFNGILLAASLGIDAGVAFRKISQK